MKLLKRFFENIKEVTSNFFKKMSQMWELGLFEFKLLYRDSKLGLIWAILSPLTQIGVYWLVFGLGIRKGGAIDGFPFLTWMVCGITPWIFISKALLGGSGELKNKLPVLSKVDMPQYVILGGKMVAYFLDHIWLIAIMFIIMLCNGWTPDLYALNLIYYVFAALMFSLAFSMVMSVLTLVATDFKRLLESILRLLMYLSPVIWSIEESGSGLLITFNKLSPFAYIINGYRDSLLYGKGFWEHPVLLAVFWGITVILYLIGCQVQSRVRSKLADYN